VRTELKESCIWVITDSTDRVEMIGIRGGGGGGGARRLGPTVQVNRLLQLT